MVYDASLDRIDLGWEIHRDWRTAGDYPTGNEAEKREGYINFLGVPTYFLQAEPKIEQSLVYPLEEVARAIKCPLRPSGDGGYFESSIGYMLGLLILQTIQGNAPEKVGIWGIDLMTGGEYAYQRPNAEYMIGFLRGLGVVVYIPKRSALLSSEYTEPPYRYE